MSIELYCAEPTGSPENTLYAWDISHTLVTTYHPYCHSPSALTEYLKQKLHLQRAKRLGRSLPAQVEQSVQLERNKFIQGKEPKDNYYTPSKGGCYVRVERSARLEQTGYDQAASLVANEASASGTR